MKRTHCKYCGNKIQKKISRRGYCSLKCALSNDVERLTCNIDSINYKLRHDKYSQIYGKRKEYESHIKHWEMELSKKEKDLQNVAICKNCEKEFIKSGVKWKSQYKWKDEYCSSKCHKESISITKTCKQCGKFFKTTYKYAKYCSGACEHKSMKQVCKNCGDIVYSVKKDVLCDKCYKESFATTCLNCGKILRVNRKLVLNKANLNKLIKKGYSLKRINSTYYFDDSKRYCDINCIIEKETPYYYKGINKEEYPHEFNESLKNQIRERDNHQCQLCGTKYPEKALSIHHIDYNKTHNTSDNLISLCNSCHTKTNTNRHYWVNHFSNIMLRYGYLN